MKEINTESFTFQSFVKSHNIRSNKWFNTEYHGGNGVCTVLTDDAEEYLRKNGVVKMCAPGTDCYNRWPMSAYSILEEMVDDNDIEHDEIRTLLSSLRESMTDLERHAKTTIEMIDKIISK